jgi:hypothetical protein
MTRRYEDVRKRRVKGYATHFRQTMALPGVAAFTAERLGLVSSIFGRLFSDEYLVTLLRAESITTVPAYLAKLLEKRKRRQ